MRTKEKSFGSQEDSESRRLAISNACDKLYFQSSGCNNPSNLGWQQNEFLLHKNQWRNLSYAMYFDKHAMQSPLKFCGEKIHEVSILKNKMFFC